MANYKNVSKLVRDAVEEIVEQFILQVDPLVGKDITILVDSFNGSVFSECHVRASKLVELGTTEVPLDPDDSAEYKANRDVVENHAAFKDMTAHALAGRYFSNIVAEYDPSAGLPLQIIGGQHRFAAISEALEEGVDELHGLKVYFNLDTEQRIDAQVISNTNIAVSRDLLDRMYETVRGSDLRDWCQKVGLLGKDEDFADRRTRGNPITVRQARTFIANYFLGSDNAKGKFEKIDTTPIIVDTGKKEIEDWNQILARSPSPFLDAGLLRAGKAFAALDEDQKQFWESKGGAKRNDYGNKASNMAIVASWAYVAGLLAPNATRRKKHFEIGKALSSDRLRADLLAKARHNSDADNYRGLGYRQDAKERGRLVEVFWLQAEKGGGLTAKLIDAGISSYHAKQATIQADKKKQALK